VIGGKYKKLIYILLTLTLSLFVCEFFLRVYWEPREKSLYPFLQNPFIGQNVYYPNKKYIVPHIITPYSMKKDNIIETTNAFGFRSSSMKEIKKEKNVYRIFFLGDSTIAQMNLPENETSWKIIEECRNKNSNKIRFECINAGMNSMDSQTAVAIMAHELIHYDPDMVIIMLGINDLSSVFLQRRYDPFHKRRIAYSLPFRDILKELYKKSYTCIFIKRNIFDRITNASYKEPELTKLEKLRAKWKKAQKKIFTDFPSINEFKKNIKSLIGITKTNNIRICFLTQPSLYSENMPEEQTDVTWCVNEEDSVTADVSTLYRGMNIFNEQIRVICRENNTEFIDIANKVPKDLRYFIDQCHYTPQGAELIARNIISYFEENEEKFAYAK